MTKRKPTQLDLFAEKRVPFARATSRITVKAILREEPDVDLYVKALMELARQQIATKGINVPGDDISRSR